jgi:hypothetical protein
MMKKDEQECEGVKGKKDGDHLGTRRRKKSDTDDKTAEYNCKHRPD